MAGALNAPASWARRMSRDGRVASFWTPSASIRPAADDAAGDLDELVRADRVDHGLRDDVLVARPEGDGRRAVEERGDARVALLLGRDPHEAVLHDPVGDVVTSKRAPDLPDLPDLQAPVLGRDQRGAPGELLTELGDGRALRLGRHAALTYRALPARPVDPPGGVPARRCIPRVSQVSARILPGEGGRSWSCLGVPAGVPGPALAGVGPVRRIEPRPSRRPSGAGATRPAGAGCLRRSVFDLMRRAGPAGRAAGW